jgi:uroporphyrinogen decarboxylase
VGAHLSTRSQRLEAAIAGEVADRPPVALWRHFPVDDQDPALLAEAALAFQREFDFDFVKVTPASSFCVRDWGARDVWKGDPEGTRQYSERVVVESKDWRALEHLDPTKGSLGDQLRCLQLIGEGLDPDTPFVQTVFSPLSQAKNLAGEGRLMEHIRVAPEAVLAGLEIIVQSTIGFVEAARKQGIAGIFYAAQQATFRLMDLEAYRRFGEPFDRRILEAAGGLWLNVLHLHGQGVMFALAESYPVQIVNWHDRETSPDLAAARERTRAALCGGLRQWDTMVLGDPQSVEAEARAAIRATQGRGFILGTGCVVPIVAPRANILAARRSVGFA